MTQPAFVDTSPRLVSFSVRNKVMEFVHDFSASHHRTDSIQGGIALLALLLRKFGDEDLTVLDLGDSKIVGIGTIASSKRGRVFIAGTGSPGSLLERNLNLNEHLWKQEQLDHTRAPHLIHLQWGMSLMWDSITGSPMGKTVLVADGILTLGTLNFSHILKTLAEIQPRVHEVFISCISTSKNLDEFVETSKRHSIRASIPFVVDISDGAEGPSEKPLDILDLATLYSVDDQTSARLKYPPKHGRVYVLRIARIPYTFQI